MIRNYSNGVIWQENTRKMVDWRERKLRFRINRENGERVIKMRKKTPGTIYISRKRQAVFCNQRTNKFQRALNRKRLTGSH